MNKNAHPGTLNLEVISRYPTGSAQPTPLLFVHGTSHGAWCWDVHFLDYFAQHGFAAHAVNLRGHGNSDGREQLRWTRISDFVEDLAEAVRRMPSPPILIGHSMGGFIIQKYLENHSAPAAVLLSSPSPAGLLPTALRSARRHPLTFAKVSLTRSLWPLIATPGLAREAFYAKDLPEERMEAYWKQMQDDSFMAFLDMVALDLPKPAKVKTPLLVIGVGLDNMIGPHEVEATARAYNTRAVIVPGVAHNSMLDPRWPAVGERVLEWIQARCAGNASLSGNGLPGKSHTTGD
jgi:pimeloyl-ACP methyl ester carboxylesterase